MGLDSTVALLMAHRPFAPRAADSHSLALSRAAAADSCLLALTETGNMPLLLRFLSEYAVRPTTAAALRRALELEDHEAIGLLTPFYPQAVEFLAQQGCPIDGDLYQHARTINPNSATTAASAANHGDSTNNSLCATGGAGGGGGCSGACLPVAPPSAPAPTLGVTAGFAPTSAAAAACHLAPSDDACLSVAAARAVANGVDTGKTTARANARARLDTRAQRGWGGNTCVSPHSPSDSMSSDDLDQQHHQSDAADGSNGALIRQSKGLSRGWEGGLPVLDGLTGQQKAALLKYLHSKAGAIAAPTLEQLQLATTHTHAITADNDDNASASTNGSASASASAGDMTELLLSPHPFIPVTSSLLSNPSSSSSSSSSSSDDLSSLSSASPLGVATVAAIANILSPNSTSSSTNAKTAKTKAAGVHSAYSGLATLVPVAEPYLPNASASASASSPVSASTFGVPSTNQPPVTAAGLSPLAASGVSSASLSAPLAPGDLVSALLAQPRTAVALSALIVAQVTGKRFNNALAPHSPSGKANATLAKDGTGSLSSDDDSSLSSSSSSSSSSASTSQVTVSGTRAWRPAASRVAPLAATAFPFPHLHSSALAYTTSAGAGACSDTATTPSGLSYPVRGCATIGTTVVTANSSNSNSSSSSSSSAGLVTLASPTLTPALAHLTRLPFATAVPLAVAEAAAAVAAAPSYGVRLTGALEGDFYSVDDSDPRAVACAEALYSAAQQYYRPPTTPVLALAHTGGALRHGHTNNNSNIGGVSGLGAGSGGSNNALASAGSGGAGTGSTAAAAAAATAAAASAHGVLSAGVTTAASPAPQCCCWDALLSPPHLRKLLSSTTAGGAGSNSASTSTGSTSAGVGASAATALVAAYLKFAALTKALISIASAGAGASGPNSGLMVLFGHFVVSVLHARVFVALRTLALLGVLTQSSVYATKTNPVDNNNHGYYDDEDNNASVDSTAESLNIGSRSASLAVTVRASGGGGYSTRLAPPQPAAQSLSQLTARVLALPLSRTYLTRALASEVGPAAATAVARLLFASTPSAHGTHGARGGAAGTRVHGQITLGDAFNALVADMRRVQRALTVEPVSPAALTAAPASANTSSYGKGKSGTASTGTITFSADVCDGAGAGVGAGAGEGSPLGQSQLLLRSNLRSSGQSRGRSRAGLANSQALTQSQALAQLLSRSAVLTSLPKSGYDGATGCNGGSSDAVAALAALSVSSSSAAGAGVSGYSNGIYGTFTHPLSLETNSAAYNHNYPIDTAQNSSHSGNTVDAFPFSFAASQSSADDASARKIAVQPAVAFSFPLSYYSALRSRFPELVATPAAASATAAAVRARIAAGDGGGAGESDVGAAEALDEVALHQLACYALFCHAGSGGGCSFDANKDSLYDDDVQQVTFPLPSNTANGSPASASAGATPKSVNSPSAQSAFASTTSSSAVATARVFGASARAIGGVGGGGGGAGSTKGSGVSSASAAACRHCGEALAVKLIARDRLARALKLRVALLRGERARQVARLRERQETLRRERERDIALGRFPITGGAGAAGVALGASGRGGVLSQSGAVSLSSSHANSMNTLNARATAGNAPGVATMKQALAAARKSRGIGSASGSDSGAAAHLRTARLCVAAATETQRVSQEYAALTATLRSSDVGPVTGLGPHGFGNTQQCGPGSHSNMTVGTFSFAGVSGGLGADSFVGEDGLDKGESDALKMVYSLMQQAM
mgnify:CR=1 FL=1